jgi:hypothetical protein
MKNPCNECEFKEEHFCLNVMGERSTGIVGACGPYNQWLGGQKIAGEIVEFLKDGGYGIQREGLPAKEFYLKYGLNPRYDIVQNLSEWLTSK